MTVILDQFVQTLRECGLMTAEEIDAFLVGLPADEKPQSGEDLAKLLHRYKKLTKFQAQAVYQGKTKGLIFGNYTVLDKIGQGGMGYVYKAQHRRMKRVVALKVLPSAVAKSPAAIKRFEREVEAAAKLSHPNIVTAHDADEADGIHFLVMEYVDGTDLADVVRRDGPLPVSLAIDYIIQAAKGLEFAHRRQVVHRDIKPSNLVLDREGVVKILDMGLARFEREIEVATRSESLTVSGQVMGTLDYMSPEQAHDAHRADARADIYSLGCTLFYLLIGRPIFGGDTLTQKILAHRDEPAPLLPSLREGIRPELDAVFRRMVAKRPEDRQSSMSEVVIALEACQLEACRDLEAQTVVDTASFHAGPTGGGDTAIRAADDFADLTVREETAGEQWLHAPLPLLPTLIRRPARKPGVWDPKWLVPGAIAVGVAFVALLLGVVLRFNTSEGTLVVEVNQPDAQVEVDGGKFTITTPDSQEAVEIEVDAGQHTLRVTKGGFQSFTKEFSISSRGKETIHVELQAATKKSAARPPAPPVAATPPANAASAASPDAPISTVAPAVEKSEDVFQKVNEQLARGTWIAVTPAMMARWSLVDEKTYARLVDRPVLTDGRIQLRNMRLDPGLVFRHGAIRAKVRLIEGQGVLFTLRNQPQHCYATTIEGAAYRLASHQYYPPNPFVSSELDKYETKTAYSGEHEILFAAVGEDLLCCLDGQPILRWRDTMPVAGTFFLGTLNDAAAEFRDIAFLVLDDPPDASVRAVLPQFKSPFIGPDGNWQIPPGAPQPAIAPFDGNMAKEHQEAWAKYLGVPVESTNSIGMKLVLIPPGEFDMGSTQEEVEQRLAEAKQSNEPSWAIDLLPGEVPQHRVRLTRAFCLGACEVTVGQFRQFVADTEYVTEGEKDGKGGHGADADATGKWGQKPEFTWRQPSFAQSDDHPVIQVSWNDAAAYCEWLSRKEGTTYRVPTEAQWEYACRAGSTTKWFCGNEESDLGQYAWYRGNSQWSTHPVSEKKPNGWGLYDMHGNVSEWCADWYVGDYYTKSPVDDPAGPSTGFDRVVRGGSWAPAAAGCQSANRVGNPLSFRSYVHGFRVVTVPSSK